MNPPVNINIYDHDQTSISLSSPSVEEQSQAAGVGSACLDQPTTNPEDEIIEIEPKLNDGILEPVFLDQRAYFVCPNCNFQGNTYVERVRGYCSCLCFLFCCDCFDDYQHSCPQCNTIMETYQIA